jgi:hypothetical protein
MKTQENNPTIAPLLRWMYVLIIIVVLAGAGLFFVPEVLAPRWPWPLAPFNARFLGSIYLAELIILAITVVVNRWAPARLVLPASFVFAGLVTLVSLLYLDRFDFQKWTAWAWFVLYALPMIGFAYYLWLYRGLPPAVPTPAPPLWRTYLLAQGVAAGLYGAGLLVAPDGFSFFWPWKIDNFHARLYSSVFFVIAAGTLALWRAAAPIEFFTLGISQAALGLFAILGLAIVDASVHRVDWSSPDTWLWLAGFAGLLLAGGAMMWWSFLTSRARVEAPAPTG